MKTKVWVGLWLACVLSAGAQGVPDTFNYQGVLRGGSGEFLAAGTYNVGFRLYPEATTGNAQWGRQYAVLLDSNGLFNVEMDDGSGSVIIPNSTLSGTISSNETLYLGLTVQGSTEIAPRQQLLSVPYALRAGDVKEAAGDFEVAGILRVNDGAIVEGTVQATTSLQVGNSGTGVATLTVEEGALKVDTKFAGRGTVPIGSILMWSGDTNAIPDGWFLCNGQNGTPNLVDRFIIGAGNHYALNATGGATNATLSKANLPAHDHDFKDAYYAESVVPSKLPTGGGYTNLGYEVTGSGNHDADNNYMYWRPMTTDSSGSGSSFSILPPYYAVYYIMRKQ